MEDSSQSQHSEASPQHSPAPWRAIRNVFTHDVIAPDGSVVALVYSPADPDLTSRGNADLITAAPKMLAALIALREADRSSDQSAVHNQADDAIAEALGRQP